MSVKSERRKQLSIDSANRKMGQVKAGGFSPYASKFAARRSYQEGAENPRPAPMQAEYTRPYWPANKQPSNVTVVFEYPDYVKNGSYDIVSRFYKSK